MFGYGGSFGYQEEANGLKLLGHRYYDPDTGRFLTRDPAKDGRNCYTYSENSPIRFADPDGRFALVIGVIVVVIGVIAFGVFIFKVVEMISRFREDVHKRHKKLEELQEELGG